MSDRLLNSVAAGFIAGVVAFVVVIVSFSLVGLVVDPVFWVMWRTAALVGMVVFLLSMAAVFFDATLSPNDDGRCS